MDVRFSRKKSLQQVVWGACVLLSALASNMALASDPKKSLSAQSSSSQGITFDSGTQRVHLLELFSSQGCSSCPPAERWMSLLTTDQRLWSELIPVVFHVDYWDYLGWEDPYATLKNSQRQRMYQLHDHSKAVYTPGFILSGEEWTDWFHTRMLPELAPEPAGQLKVKIANDKLQAKFVRSQGNQGLVLNVALLGFGIVTEVAQGENKGMMLPQDFVVLTYTSFDSDTGMWHVSMPKTEFQGKTAAVFWVSQGSDPAPVQATGGWYRAAASEVSNNKVFNNKVFSNKASSSKVSSNKPSDN